MPDEVTVPTKEEIAQLPRWAKVAFAARCARRVLPLFKHHWPEAPKEHENAVIRAAEVAELCTDFVEIDGFTAFAIADRARTAVKAAISAKDNGAADVAVSAANAAVSTDVRLHPDPLDAADAAVSAAAEAALADRGVLSAIRQDFQHILDASRQGNWTDDTLVFPWVFGPMWPNGVPEGWPEADPQERLQVTVGVPEGAPPEQTAKYLNRLHALLNKLNIQNGGAGITIDTVRREQPKEAPVPVGGES